MPPASAAVYKVYDVYQVLYAMYVNVLRLDSNWKNIFAIYISFAMVTPTGKVTIKFTGCN